jgi:hypothetical protein
MKLNLSWGILALGDPIETTEYGRQFSPDAYTGKCRNIIQVLIPVGSSDNMLRALHIEEMIKVVRRSSLKSRFDALDTFNTYDNAALRFPSPGIHIGGYEDINPKIIGDVPTSRFRVSAEVLIGLLPQDLLSCSITYHNYSDNIRLNTSKVCYPIVFNNGQSNDIPVVDNALYIRLHEPIPTSFTIAFEYISKIHVDWTSIISNAESIGHTFSSPELRDIWSQESNWVERISALILDVLETCSGR